jgi:hypothetical protein
MYNGEPLLWGISGRIMKLTTHFLFAEVMKGGAISPLPISHQGVVLN